MRVLIADDHPLILAGIKSALEEAEGFEVVAETNNGAQVLPLVSQTKPDLALLDMRMPGMDGLPCLDRIRARHPEVKVVILSVSTEPDVIQDVLNRGASAYIVKSVSPVDVPSALRQAVEGSVFSAIGLPEKQVANDAAKAAGLTERETSILKALARGLSNDAIGKELWVAEQTVKFHLTNIYRKLGVSNRTEATRYAYEHGLVDLSARSRLSRNAERLTLSMMLRGRFLQPFWTRVHGVALSGMNVGNDDQATNGELWLLERLATSLPPSPVVFDVGANVGRYSEAVLERMPGARLYAFEPSATAFAKLQASFGQRARTFRHALGAEDGERPLYADRPGSELGSLIHRDLHRYGLAVGEQE